MPLVVCVLVNVQSVSIAKVLFSFRLSSPFITMVLHDCYFKQFDDTDVQC